MADCRIADPTHGGLLRQPDNHDYNKVVPKAKGEADQAISTTEGYKFKRVNEAEGDVAAFNAVLAEYIKSPEITRTRIYLETMAEILPQAGQKFIVDEPRRDAKRAV